MKKLKLLKEFFVTERDNSWYAPLQEEIQHYMTFKFTTDTRAADDNMKKHIDGITVNVADYGKVLRLGNSDQFTLNALVNAFLSIASTKEVDQIMKATFIIETERGDCKGRDLDEHFEIFITNTRDNPATGFRLPVIEFEDKIPQAFLAESPRNVIIERIPEDNDIIDQTPVNNLREGLKGPRLLIQEVYPIPQGRFSFKEKDFIEAILTTTLKVRQEPAIDTGGVSNEYIQSALYLYFNDNFEMYPTGYFFRPVMPTTNKTAITLFCGIL